MCLSLASSITQCFEIRILLATRYHCQFETYFNLFLPHRHSRCIKVSELVISPNIIVHGPSMKSSRIVLHQRGVRSVLVMTRTWRNIQPQQENIQSYPHPHHLLGGSCDKQLVSWSWFHLVSVIFSCLYISTKLNMDKTFSKYDDKVVRKCVKM